MATVTTEKGQRTVKNLGWLLRNWKAVSGFEVVTITPIPGTSSLEAFTARGGYTTVFADPGVLRDFLDRPVFRGLACSWNGRTLEIGSIVWRAMRVYFPRDCKGRRFEEVLEQREGTSYPPGCIAPACGKAHLSTTTHEIYHGSNYSAACEYCYGWENALICHWCGAWFEEIAHDSSDCIRRLNRGQRF